MRELNFQEILTGSLHSILNSTQKPSLDIVLLKYILHIFY